MYHIVYLTTNIANQKFYVGVHSTYNLDDGYLGSGIILKNAINKYGKNNFKRQILYYCLTAIDAYEIESKIVNKNLTSRFDCYNIVLGGFGGYQLFNSHIENINSFKDKCIKRMLGKNNPMYNKKHTEETKSKIRKTRAERIYIISNETREKISKSSIGRKPMLGKKLSYETKIKISVRLIHKFPKL